MANSGESPVSLEDRQKECKPLVLIIDDQPEYARLFELLAESLGIKAHIVSSCREGLKALELFSFDVVLMDWLMPDVDGPECACRIRKMEQEKGGHIPIIGVSGYVKATREDCLAAGMDDYLPIPFTYQQLHDILCKWLQRKEE
ncbi:MAG: response regulator [Candidatus Melainabacteria bacterium]|jgi:CheY-like chemotaxis protein|nr:response regulator [Candidatus Melainabacteria bacterium]